MIDYSQLTIPTGAEYQASDPQKQQENLAYVQLQEYQLLQDAYNANQTAFTSLWTAQTNIIIEQTTLLTTIKTTLRTGEVYCEKLIAENTELQTLPQTRPNYHLREIVLARHDLAIQHLRQANNLEDLQYNSVEYDLDVLKILLFGRNMFVSP